MIEPWVGGRMPLAVMESISPRVSSNVCSDPQHADQKPLKCEPLLL